MSEREEKVKREVKTDEYGNVTKEEVRREVIQRVKPNKIWKMLETR